MPKTPAKKDNKPSYAHKSAGTRKVQAVAAVEPAHELAEVNRKIIQARDLLSSIFNANPIPTALIRMVDDVFLNVNVEFLSYFGLQRDTVIGHSAEEFNLGLGLETTGREGLIARVKEEGKVRNLEAEINHPSGETRNILASLQYINLDNSDALIFTFIDITDRVRAERLVRALASDLTEAEQQERHRISEILHDDLQQRLFAVKAQLRMVDEAHQRQDTKGLQSLIAEMDEWLTEAISVMRNLSIEISPIILHGEGLADAIAWLSTQMLRQYNLEVVLHTDGVKTGFARSLRVMLFQAVRELLFNVVKHSETLQAVVSMERSKGLVRITVTDQGKGFDPESVLKNAAVAHGLMSIRNRLDLLGCRMDIQSQPGAGARITIDCPQPDPEEEI